MAWLTTCTLKTRFDKNDTPWSRQFILIKPNEEEIVKSQQNWLILSQYSASTPPAYVFRGYRNGTLGLHQVNHYFDNYQK